MGLQSVISDGSVMMDFGLVCDLSCFDVNCNCRFATVVICGWMVMGEFGTEEREDGYGFVL
jgi:hypothetical protein